MYLLLKQRHHKICPVVCNAPTTPIPLLETKSYQLAPAGLGLTIQTKLTSNSEIWLPLPSECTTKPDPQYTLDFVMV